MPLVSFNNLSEVDKTNAIETLITQSTPDRDFFFMTILSVLMAAFGILIDNVTVIIGSMLIAPLLSPILSLSLGIITSDAGLISRSGHTIFKSVWLSIAAAGVAAILFSGGMDLSHVVKNSQPNFLYIGVAIIAGFAATFALVKPKLNETLPGAAIAVALIPPLSMVGVGLAMFNWEVMTNAFIIFVLNFIGIVFASMVAFSLMNFYVKKKMVQHVLKEEEKKLKYEEGVAEHISKQR